MAIVTLPTTLADSTVPSAADFMGNYNAIVNEMNGNLDNANIKENAAIAGSKIDRDTDGTLAANSDTAIPSQKAIKTYVDSVSRLRSMVQTNLASSFSAASGTAEQEVTGLRVSLPIIAGGTSCTVKITLSAYVFTPAGNNNVRVRVGASVTYLSNTEVNNLYVPGTATTPSLSGLVVVTGLDLTTQKYVVVSVQNDVNASGLTISALVARSTVVTEVYQ